MPRLIPQASITPELSLDSVNVPAAVVANRAKPTPGTASAETPVIAALLIVVANPPTVVSTTP